MISNVLVGDDSVRNHGPVDLCGELKFCPWYHEMCLQYDAYFFNKSRKCFCEE